MADFSVHLAPNPFTNWEPTDDGEAASATADIHLGDFYGAPVSRMMMVVERDSDGKLLRIQVSRGPADKRLAFMRKDETYDGPDSHALAAFGLALGRALGANPLGNRPGATGFSIEIK